MTSIEAQGDKHRTERHAEAHGDHHDDGHDHGSVRSYLTGFILSVILTAIPFAIVMAGGFESRFLTAAVVVGMAIVQILVLVAVVLWWRHPDRPGLFPVRRRRRPSARGEPTGGASAGKPVGAAKVRAR